MGFDQNLAKLLNTIINSFVDLCRCDGGSIFTLRRDPSTDEQVLSFETIVTRSIALQNVPEHLKDLRFKLGDNTLVSRTAQLKAPQRMNYHADGAAPKYDPKLNYTTHNIMSAPLLTPRGDLVGVVQLVNKLPYPGRSDRGANPDFDERDERIFKIVAGQAALAIENSMLLEEQERLLEGFVNACVTAVEARDPVTSGHSNRVSDYTVALALACNRVERGRLAEVRFSEMQLREIRYAAMLHDIGKISVHEDVLNKEKKLHQWQLEVIRMRLKLMRASFKLKERETGVRHDFELKQLETAWKLISDANEPSVLPAEVNTAIQGLAAIGIDLEDGEHLQALTREEGFRLAIPKGSLTAEERREIELHVTNTFEILKMVPWSRGLELVPEIAYRHHEKLDGSGYPCKCEAMHIPVQSRLLTICDIYDALTADDRPYKRALPVEKALDILGFEVKAGKLDADCFSLFVDAKVFETCKPRKRETEKKAA